MRITDRNPSPVRVLSHSPRIAENDGEDELACTHEHVPGIARNNDRHAQDTRTGDRPAVVEVGEVVQRVEVCAADRAQMGFT